jgi:hypothetical protein
LARLLVDGIGESLDARKGSNAAVRLIDSKGDEVL